MNAKQESDTLGTLEGKGNTYLKMAKYDVDGLRRDFSNSFWWHDD
jgi:hypothetical protein